MVSTCRLLQNPETLVHLCHLCLTVQAPEVIMMGDDGSMRPVGTRQLCEWCARTLEPGLVSWLLTRDWRVLCLTHSDWHDRLQRCGRVLVWHPAVGGGHWRAALCRCGEHVPAGHAGDSEGPTANHTIRLSCTPRRPHDCMLAPEASPTTNLSGERCGITPLCCACVVVSIVWCRWSLTLLRRGFV